MEGAAATKWTIQFFVGFDGVCVNPAGGPVISLGDNNNGGSVDSPLDNGAAASSSSNAAASIGIPVGVVAGCLLIVLVVLVVARSRNGANKVSLVDLCIFFLCRYLCRYLCICLSVDLWICGSVDL